MNFSPLNWLGRNLGALILAFVLAVIVWISAVATSDPNVEQAYRPLPIEVRGLDPSTVLVNQIPEEARVVVSAPRSVWTQLSASRGLIKTWIDLSGLDPGTHTVEVQRSVDPSVRRLVQITSIDPAGVEVVLEPLVSETFAVQLTVRGEPDVRYKKGAASFSPQQVSVSGPESAVAQVAEVRANLEIDGATDTIQRNDVSLEAVNQAGLPVTGVTITPNRVSVTQSITLLGGSKNVVVRVVTQGQPALGYRLTNISVTPPIVTVFSANPQNVTDIPGYVETKPVDLSGLTDDAEVRVELDLPPNVSLVGEQSVLVQIGVAAQEGSYQISLPIESVGLPPQFQARVSPDTVDVIVSGPRPVLDNLTPASFRVIVDLSGLGTGTYQLSPTVDLIPTQVELQSIQPETVEVTIMDAQTSTPAAATANQPTPAVAGTQTPVPTIGP